MSRLATLSETLLRTLGRCSAQGHLQRVLQHCGLSTDGLLREAPADKPYPVSWPAAGVSILMQRMNAATTEGEAAWGVQSVSLQAGSWRGPWLKDLDPQYATAQDVVALLAPEDEEALCTPEMACVSTPGPDGQRWTVLALFDPEGAKLQSLTFTRASEWVAASVLPPWPALPQPEDPSAMAQPWARR